MPLPASGHSWLIKGGRIIDPARKLDRVGDLALSQGVVAESPGAADLSVFDARGLIVAPGLMDIHVHLREPGGEHKETIATGTAAAVAGGFTAVACMPNTTPPLDSPERVAWVRERARTSAACRVLPIAAATLGRESRRLVDFAALRRAGAAAFSDDGDGIADDGVMQAVLEQIRMAGSLLIQHCEDTRLSAGGVIQAGAAAQRLNLPGQDPYAEAAMLERDLRLVRRTGARYHAAHLSTEAAVDLVRKAKAEGLPVTAEVCPHHLTLCDQDVLDSGGDPNLKMNPPLRSSADVRACVEGLLDGTLDCIVTDHAPHAPEEKSVGFAQAPFGIVGLETALSLVYRVLIESGRADWMTLVRLMSTGPARVLGLPTPTLAAGQPADITIIDPEAHWTVEPEKFASKGRNTPYRGWKLSCRAAATLVAGEMRYRLPDRSYSV
ncbi:MAG: dihydroorotase [Planctomycetota bacterium]